MFWVLRLWLTGWLACLGAGCRLLSFHFSTSALSAVHQARQQILSWRPCCRGAGMTSSHPGFSRPSCFPLDCCQLA